MKQERTPGPWRPVGDHYITGADEVRQVAEVYSVQDRDLIVHCVSTHDDLVRALESVMVGGNHLGLIIGVDHPPYTASFDDALTHYMGSGGTWQRDKYEAWCCWKNIMGARAALKLAKGGENA